MTQEPASKLELRICRYTSVAKLLKLTLKRRFIIRVWFRIIYMSFRLPAVKISTPVSVILQTRILGHSNRPHKITTHNRVSSNCALFFPSVVVAVQLSGQCTLSQWPKLIIWKTGQFRILATYPVTYRFYCKCLRRERWRENHSVSQLNKRTIPAFIVPTALFFA